MAEKPDFFYEDFVNGATVIGNWQGKVKVSLRAALTAKPLEILYHMTKFFLFQVFNCSLLLQKNFSVSHYFIYKNCFGLFLSAYFLFLEILNLNLPFAVCRNLDP